MADLPADFENNPRRFTDLLGWADNASMLLGALFVIVLALAWWLR